MFGTLELNSLWNSLLSKLMEFTSMFYPKELVWVFWKWDFLNLIINKFCPSRIFAPLLPCRLPRCRNPLPPYRHILLHLLWSQLPPPPFSISASSPSVHDWTEHRSPNRLEALNLKKEKLSHFRFYRNDIINGLNSTSVPVIPPSIISFLEISFSAVPSLFFVLLIAFDAGFWLSMIVFIIFNFQFWLFLSGLLFSILGFDPWLIVLVVMPTGSLLIQM